jgi:hypothetical protein
MTTMGQSLHTNFAMILGRRFHSRAPIFGSYCPDGLSKFRHRCAIEGGIK